MNCPIPGYYYDQEKKKYFKIQKSHTAPGEAAWSPDKIKRRKIEDQAASDRQRRERATRNHIRRARALRDPLLGGFLDRQLGVPPSTPDGTKALLDVPAATWAASFSERGALPLSPRSAAMFWIGGEEEETGVGVIYFSSSATLLRSSYIPMDTDGCISFADGRSQDDDDYTRQRRLYSEYHLRDYPLSSMTYHKPSNGFLCTTLEPKQFPEISVFRPRRTSPQEGRPTWLLGQIEGHAETFRSRVRRPNGRRTFMNLATPAPEAASDLICAIGTDAGVACLHSSGDVVWLAPDDSSGQNILNWKKERVDVLAQSFHPANPDILFAGQRSSRIQIIDRRVPPDNHRFFHHASAVAHIHALEGKGISGYQVLAAGPCSAMCIYDTRYLSQQPGKAQATPVVSFPAYRNMAQVRIGLAVDPDAGVVAAAHDDGRVCLYSLNSGRSLPSVAVDGILAPRGPVASLAFKALPGERRASIWAGIDDSVYKFSTDGFNGEGFPEE